MSSAGFDKEGRWVPNPDIAAHYRGRAFDLVSNSDDHLLLAAENAGNLQMAGRLETISISELISFFNMYRKDGILRVQTQDGLKSLYFQQGEIVLAETGLLEEELGEILFGLGKVDREDLQRVRKTVKNDADLGQALVRQGLLTAKDLWHGVRFQIESIVYNLLACQKGNFVFQDWRPAKEKTVRLSLNTQNLIMEGVRRIDERSLFQRKIPSLDVFPVPVADSPTGLNAAEERMFDLVRTGQGDIRTLVRKSGMGEFEGLRILYHLIEKKVVRVEEAPPVSTEGELVEILKIFNGALAALYGKVSARNAGFRNEIKVFLRDLPQPYSFVLRDAELQENGAISGSRILANLAGLEEGDKMKLLADSLNELIYMECMAARRDLGEAEAAGLTRRVQEIVRRVKSIVERKS